jgi:hypothetical protein
MIEKEIFGRFYLPISYLLVPFSFQPKGKVWFLPFLSCLTMIRVNNHLLLDFVYMLMKLEKLMVFCAFP